MKFSAIRKMTGYGKWGRSKSRACFFPIVVATATGLTAVPASPMDLIHSLSASQTQTFIKIRFPTAMPHIFVGLRSPSPLR
jgi:NitT/TauT family transport system permease protein